MLIFFFVDKYPKAHRHYLILPKADLPDLSYLTREHCPLIEKMTDMAIEFAAANNIRHYKLGFHSAAHMTRVCR